ncbi:hypothetical protein LJC22_01645 [Desulfosarcina sp. OttesenSCG-928-G10]|nr:hypothetical protein [Desulfosarcina sp. OttesenSCG-928-G10]MDL2321807.1 hypothetical protein [Desulfosarcina sp. OttesenSCG-928-B08]
MQKRFSGFFFSSQKKIPWRVADIRNFQAKPVLPSFLKHQHCKGAHVSVKNKICAVCFDNLQALFVHLNKADAIILHLALPPQTQGPDQYRRQCHRTDEQHPQ